MNEQRPLLAVEDDPNDIEFLRFSLSKAGVTAVHHVADGEQALLYLTGAGPFADRDRHPLPALILLDLKLPRKSGLEVLEWLKRQPGLRRIPVIVLTASRELPDVARAYDLGANSYLVKPINLSELERIAAEIKSYWLTLNQGAEI